MECGDHGEHDHGEHDHNEHDHNEADVDSTRFGADSDLAKLAVEDILLREGDTGTSVIKVQQALVDLGHLDSSAITFGTFGAATTTAVRAFQRASGAAVDGVIGDETFAALDGRFVDYSVEGANLASTTPANRLDATRAISVEEADAFNEAIGTGVRADPLTGLLPDFDETVEGRTYGERVDEAINRIVDIYLGRAQSAQQNRNDGHTYDWGDINDVGVQSKQATDASFGSYAAGPPMSGGTVSSIIQDAWNTKEQELAGDPAAVGDDWAEWRVRKIITGSQSVRDIDEKHGAVQSRPDEEAILTAIKTRIATSRRAELILIHKNWPAFATPDTGQVHIQIIQDVDSTGNLDNSAGREYMWETYQTLIHEYVHTLEHADHVAYRGGMSAQEGGFTLREGTTDYFTKIAYNNFAVTDATRQAVEGPYHVGGVTHALPDLTTYRQSENAERGASIVGLPNVCGAFFLGRIDLIGG